MSKGKNGENDGVDKIGEENDDESNDSISSNNNTNGKRKSKVNSVVFFYFHYLVHAFSLHILSCIHFALYSVVFFTRMMASAKEIVRDQIVMGRVMKFRIRTISLTTIAHKVLQMVRMAAGSIHSILTKLVNSIR